MSFVRLLLAGLVAATGMVLTSPAPAQACSCVMAGPKQYVEWAGVVFTGTLTERTPPPTEGTWSSADPATHSFDVTEVYEGDVGARVDVLSAVSGASCGLEGMQEGTAYVVFAGYRDIMGESTDVLWASLCGGTSPASASLVDRVERVTGPGHSPTSEPGSTAPVPQAEGNLAGDQPPGTRSGPPGWLLWSGGSAAALLAAGALVVLRRRHSPA